MNGVTPARLLFEALTCARGFYRPTQRDGEWPRNGLISVQFSDLSAIECSEDDVRLLKHIDLGDTSRDTAAKIMMVIRRKAAAT